MSEPLLISVRPDELDGGYLAVCVTLPGCVSQGETETEALANLADAIRGVRAEAKGSEELEAKHDILASLDAAGYKRYARTLRDALAAIEAWSEGNDDEAAP